MDTGSVFIGFQSGVNINPEISKYNSAVGYEAGKNLTNGNSNTFIGYWAGLIEDVGGGNTYVGKSAGQRGSLSFRNSFFGIGAGFNNSGTDNLMLGANSGANNFTGNRNVFIGRNAGQNELGSDKLYIETAAFNEVDNTSPLIYGEFDNNLLRINGSMHVTEFANLKPRSEAPSSPETGTIYYDSDDNKVKVWTGSAWENMN